MSFFKIDGKFFFRLKTDNFHFLVRFQKTHRTGGAPTLTVPVKTLTLEIWPKMKWHTANIYRSP